MTGHNTSSTSILVVYGDVPAFDQNGIIKNYTITYRSLTEGHNGSAIAGPSDRQKELTNLREYVDYEITVLASTSKGYGPQSSPILVSTDEDSKYCYFPNLLSVINGYIQHQYAYSPYCSLYIYKGADKEGLLTNQQPL